MSKYHPLDVRHPSNRGLMRRNFLLDPRPADPQGPSTRASRLAAAASLSKPQPAQAQPAGTEQAAAPWGQRRRESPARTLPQPGSEALHDTRRRGHGLLRWLILIAVGAWVLGLIVGFDTVSMLFGDVADLFDRVTR